MFVAHCCKKICPSTAVSPSTAATSRHHCSNQARLNRHVLSLLCVYTSYLSCLRQPNDTFIDGMSRGMLREARNLHLHRRHPFFRRRVCNASVTAVASSLTFHALPVAPRAVALWEKIQPSWVPPIYVLTSCTENSSARRPLSLALSVSLSNNVCVFPELALGTVRNWPAGHGCPLFLGGVVSCCNPRYF